MVTVACQKQEAPGLAADGQKAGIFPDGRGRLQKPIYNTTGKWPLAKARQISLFSFLVVLGFELRALSLSAQLQKPHPQPCML
jgi:hypothetical protein